MLGNSINLLLLYQRCNNPETHLTPTPCAPTTTSYAKPSFNSASEVAPATPSAAGATNRFTLKEQRGHIAEGILCEMKKRLRSLLEANEEAAFEIWCESHPRDVLAKAPVRCVFSRSGQRVRDAWKACR